MRRLRTPWLISRPLRFGHDEFQLMEEVIRGLVVALREPDEDLICFLGVMVNVTGSQSAQSQVSRDQNVPPLRRHGASPTRSEFTLLEI